ncbi:MAG: type II secretion system F family protein [Pseudomonadota bacterium]
MTSFVYRAIGTDGLTVESVRDARNLDDLSRQVAAQGQVLIRARAMRRAWRAAPTAAELQGWLQQLHVLLAAGIPVSDALMLMAEAPDRTGPVSRCLLASLDRGQPLSEAMASQAAVFNASFCALVRCGEATGSLDAALSGLHALAERRTEVSRHLRRAVAYPLVTLCLLLILTPLLLSLVVPQVATLAALNGSELPWYTVALVTTADAVAALGPAVLFVAVAAAVGVALVVHVSPSAAIGFARLQLGLPLVGSVQRQAHLAVVCRQLALMHGAGLVVSDALSLAADGIPNRYLKQRVREVASDVCAGRQVHQAMARVQVFPSVVVHLIRTGEVSGRLQDTASHAAAVLEHAVSRATDRTTRALGPAVLMLVAALLIWLVAALFLPLYDTLFALGGP